ncbi:MAG: hypothetical protein V2A54_08065 [Bacteroidota bacterium]
MKKITASIALVLLATASFPQTKNILMPSDLIMNYSVPVSSDIKETIYIPFGTEITPKKYLYCDVKMSSAISFGKYIIDGIKKNKVSLLYWDKGLPGYEAPGKKLSLDEAKREMGEYVDSVSTINEKDEQVIIIVNNEAKEENFISCKYTEYWSFDAEKYSMKKEVVQYSPYVKVNFIDPFNGDVSFKGLKNIGIILSKNNASATTKLLSIRYEFPLGNNDVLAMKILKPDMMEVPDYYSFTEKEDCPFWNSYNRQKFLDALIDPVLSGKVKVTDFNSGAQLDLNTVRKNLGESADTITMVNPLYVERDTTMIIKRPATTERIWSIIFVEEWFVNPLTLDIRKHVVGIAPVMWYQTTFDMGKTFIWMKKISFLIMLN